MFPFLDRLYWHNICYSIASSHKSSHYWIVKYNNVSILFILWMAVFKNITNGNRPRVSGAVLPLDGVAPLVAHPPQWNSVTCQNPPDPKKFLHILNQSCNLKIS